MLSSKFALPQVSYPYKRHYQELCCVRAAARRGCRTRAPNVLGNEAMNHCEKAPLGFMPTEGKTGNGWRRQYGRKQIRHTVNQEFALLSNRCRSCFCNSCSVWGRVPNHPGLQTKIFCSIIGIKFIEVVAKVVWEKNRENNCRKM